jgi:2-iminobutanoate/2-iminopropanoate deaminase
VRSEVSRTTPTRCWSAAAPLLFISGQVAWDEAGSIVGAGDPLTQAVQTFANLRTVLQFHGADFSDLVKVTVYVTSFDWFEELSALREQLFSDSPPASATAEVDRLVQPGLLIEVRRSRSSPGNVAGSAEAEHRPAAGSTPPRSASPGSTRARR